MPSCLTTRDEVGTVYPSPPLFFLVGTENALRGLGLVNYLQGQSCRNAPHSVQGKDAEKKKNNPPHFLWSRYCPHQVQKLLCLRGKPAHLRGEGHNADSDSSFFLHLSQLEQILVCPKTAPAISPASHTFQVGNFFPQAGGKKILNKTVFVNLWGGEGR